MTHRDGLKSSAALFGVILAISPALGNDRSMDGSGNNLGHPDWGQSFTQLMRMMPAEYDDGMDMPAGAGRPGPRMISNILCDQVDPAPNTRGLTDWVWQWGQFLDHDISLTGGMDPPEFMPIAIPEGDPWFDVDETGEQIIPFTRSAYDPVTGAINGTPREQVNELSAFIDASNVYGADEDRAQWLRTGVRGKLKQSPGGLLPLNDGTQVNAGPGGAASFSLDLFTAGDIRASEQIGLTAVHTLFVREHNRMCDELAAAHPDWSDEEIYQQARKTVGALVQVITYHEFLPVLLGPRAPRADDAHYDPQIEPSITNMFANAAYRLGHSMVSPMMKRVMTDGSDHPEGDLSLREAYFNPRPLLEADGIEPFLSGLARQVMQEVDLLVVDDVRSFLFGGPGTGGLDLAALNIQRGRDHGLADYNMARTTMGLPAMSSFADITKSVGIQERLEYLYGSINDIDPWVGGLAEDHLSDASVGPFIAEVMIDQFTRLRDGDRFFYRYDNAFSADDIAQLEATTLADVIRRNTGITDLPDQVFLIDAPVVEPDGDVATTLTPRSSSLCGALSLFNMMLMAVGMAAGRRRLGRRQQAG